MIFIFKRRKGVTARLGSSCESYSGYVQVEVSGSRICSNCDTRSLFCTQIYLVSMGCTANA